MVGGLGEDGVLPRSALGEGWVSASCKRGDRPQAPSPVSAHVEPPLSDASSDLQVVSEPIGILVLPGRPWSYDVPDSSYVVPFKARLKLLKTTDDGKTAIARFDMPMAIYDRHGNLVTDPDMISRVVLEGNAPPTGWQWPASQRFSLTPADETSRPLRNQQRGKRKAGEDVEVCGHICTVELLTPSHLMNVQGKLDSMAIRFWDFIVIYTVTGSEVTGSELKRRSEGWQFPPHVDVISGPPDRITNVSWNDHLAYSDPPSGHESSQPLRLRNGDLHFVQVTILPLSSAECACVSCTLHSAVDRYRVSLWQVHVVDDCDYPVNLEGCLVELSCKDLETKACCEKIEQGVTKVNYPVTVPDLSEKLETNVSVRVLWSDDLQAGLRVALSSRKRVCSLQVCTASSSISSDSGE
jgi:hypothetical protein